MKYLILATLLTLSTSAIAEEVKKTTCEEIEGLSRAIMDARQAGVSLVDVANIMKGSVLKPIVIDAYSVPLWSVDANKERAVNEFANSIYLICLKDEVE
tara:strand:- start:2609 stop:2905 length:297 start_codon:yes stop_codon:yes gene_type:complete